jgi:hypothetical protein
MARDSKRSEDFKNQIPPMIEQRPHGSRVAGPIRTQLLACQGEASVKEDGGVIVKWVGDRYDGVNPFHPVCF